MGQTSKPVDGTDAETLPPGPTVEGDAATRPPRAIAEAASAETLCHSSEALDRVGIPGYTLLKVLGRGGMGVVYQARQVNLGRLVALKMILSASHASPQDVARFRTEAESMARVQHPNIVQVYEIGEHQGLPYFSLEYCDGGSLEGKLKGAPLPPDKAASLIEVLARAMQVAHRSGVVHRDLKPANVLMADCGSRIADSQNPAGAVAPEGCTLESAIRNLQSAIKITDFGLAKKLDATALTASGAILGTPSYMAPEQADCSGRQIGPAADIYALGAILYEALTGRPPFQAATPLDTILQVVADEPVPPSRLQAAGRPGNHLPEVFGEGAAATLSFGAGFGG